MPQQHSSNIEQRPSSSQDTPRRWRPAQESLTLPVIDQICLRVTIRDAHARVVPGLALSRDGRTWSKPKPWRKVDLASATCSYFVPPASEVERLRSMTRARVGVFTPRDTAITSSVAVYWSSIDGGVTASPNAGGDHDHLDCLQLANDIAQHEAMVAEFDALCKGLGSGPVVVGDPGSSGSDEPEPDLGPNYCFMRDIAQRDLEDARKAYNDKGCNRPSV